jgi:hypothetical protein
VLYHSLHLLHICYLNSLSLSLSLALSHSSLQPSLRADINYYTQQPLEYPPTISL